MPIIKAVLEQAILLAQMAALEAKLRILNDEIRDLEIECQKGKEHIAAMEEHCAKNNPHLHNAWKVCPVCGSHPEVSLDYDSEVVSDKTSLDG